MKSRLIVFLLLISPLTFAQGQRETDVGLSLSATLQKDLMQDLDISLEQEIRLKDNNIGFDRTVTSLGLDYAFLNRKIKVGAYYAFIYRYNNNFLYEPRHRYYFNLAYRQPYQRWTFSWRGRIQGTYRDENRGEYKINPRYVMRNRLEIEYSVWGRPWKPYISCEVFTDLNNPLGNDLTRIRYQAGTTWRLNRTDYVDFFLRYNDEFSGDDSRLIALGVGYRVKL
jgi:hypothetical protein